MLCMLMFYLLTRTLILTFLILDDGLQHIAAGRAGAPPFSFLPTASVPPTGRNARYLWEGDRHSGNNG